MKNHYDVVIVGGGPGGSMAALHAARKGLSVLMLERDREIGLPVRCAEGVSEKGLRSLVDVKPEGIAQKITGVTFHAPSGDTVELSTEEVGFVLHRKIFDYDLAHMAAQAGAKILTRANVVGLLKKGDDITGVQVEIMGQQHDISAKIVIGADGVESRVGRWAGLPTHTSMHDMETCAQVTASGINLSHTDIHFYFSDKMAPGGYLWVFPKGEGIANVGLGISGDHSKNKTAHEYLDDFMEKYFPDASPLTSTIGGVPCALPLKKMVSNGLMIVGDAARMANPLTGGGIINAMVAGKIAAEIAAESCEQNDHSEKILQKYAKQWHKAEGHQFGKFYNIKEAIFKFTDDDFDHIASKVLDIPPEKRTLLAVFRVALIKRPSLIIDVIKLFAS